MRERKITLTEVSNRSSLVHTIDLEIRRNEEFYIKTFVFPLFNFFIKHLTLIPFNDPMKIFNKDYIFSYGSPNLRHFMGHKWHLGGTLIAS